MPRRKPEPELTIRYHSPDLCAGEWCVLHNPSDHHMVTWPKVLKMSTMIERQCPHGIGHPDPDSVAYFNRRWPEGRGYHGMHGCDGCCGPKAAAHYRMQEAFNRRN